MENITEPWFSRIFLVSLLWHILVGQSALTPMVTPLLRQVPPSNTTASRVICHTKHLSGLSPLLVPQTWSLPTAFLTL